MYCQAKTAGCTRGLHQLIDRPRLPRRWIAAHGNGSEPVKCFVVRRVHRDQLTLHVRGQFRELNASLRQRTPHLLAVCAAFGSAIEVEQAPVPGRDLHALVAECASPARDVLQAVEWRSIASE